MTSKSESLLPQQLKINIQSDLNSTFLSSIQKPGENSLLGMTVGENDLSH